MRLALKRASRRPADEIQKARGRLELAIDALCRVQGSLFWVNGFRAGGQLVDDETLYRRQRVQWQRVAHAETAVQKAISNYTNVVRKGRR